MIYEILYSEENTAFECIRSDGHFNDIGTKNHQPDSRIPFSSEENTAFECIRSDGHFNDIGTKNHQPDSRIPFSSVNNMDSYYNNFSAENHQSNLGFSSMNDAVPFYPQGDASPGLAPSPSSSTISSADSGYSTHTEADEKAPFFQQSDASSRLASSPSSTISVTDSCYSTHPEAD
ncbi:Hypothetical predicted protein, partial [Mytilus galloprovincialis]